MKARFKASISCLLVCLFFPLAFIRIHCIYTITCGKIQDSGSCSLMFQTWTRKFGQLSAAQQIPQPFICSVQVSSETFDLPRPTCADVRRAAGRSLIRIKIWEWENLEDMGSVGKWWGSGFSTCFTCCPVPSWFSDTDRNETWISKLGRVHGLECCCLAFAATPPWITARE